MTNFDDFLNEQLQDEELRKEYEALEPAFAIVQALIDARNRMNNEIAVALNMEPDSVVELIHEKTGLEDFA